MLHEGSMLRTLTSIKSPHAIRENKSTQTPNGWSLHEARGLASEKVGPVGATSRPGFTWGTNVNIH